MSSRGKLFILSAPAGTGKTTLVNRLVKEHPNVVQSISYTTRIPRLGEKDGVHYHFISREAFEELAARGAFFEYVTLYGDYYGTSKEAVEKSLATGKNVFLVIDTQGAMKLKGQVEAIFIFISPPSLEALKERLERRKSETAEKIADRLKIANEELAKKDRYDYEIVNDDLNHAYKQLKRIVLSEEMNGHLNQ